MRNPNRSLGHQLNDAAYALGFWTMFLLFNALFFLLVVPPPPVMGVLELVYYVLFLSTALSHLASWHLDPGYLNRNKEALEQYRRYKSTEDASDSGLNKKMGPPPIGKDVIRACPTCKILKPRRSKHCTICRLCVDRFDHHCPWINNCVGQQNHRIFMVFLASLTCLLLYLSSLCFCAVISNQGFGGPDRGTLPFIQIPGLEWAGITEDYTSQSEAFFVQYFGCTVGNSTSSDECGCPPHRWTMCGMGVLYLILGSRLSYMFGEQAVRNLISESLYELFCYIFYCGTSPSCTDTTFA